MVADFRSPLPRKCILDPILALSPYGIRLVQCLGTVLELWIAREFWEFTQQTKFWASLKDDSHLVPPAIVQESAQVWLKLKNKVSPGALNLYWYGDCLWESHLPAEHVSTTFNQWENLAQGLDTFLPKGHWDSALLRDTLALAANSIDAFVLTAQTQLATPPKICTLLESAHISCQRLDQQDSLVELQTKALNNLLLQVGLAPLQWSNTQLAIVYFTIQDNTVMLSMADSSQQSVISETEYLSLLEKPLQAYTMRESSKGFWFSC